MKQKTLLVFEGLPGSGKTTTANILEKNFNFKKINESRGYFNVSDCRKAQDIIFKETINRYSLVKSLKHDKFIIDRGYMSLLAWDYCEDSLYKTKQFIEKKKWINEAFGKKEIFHPTLYVYFKINSKKSKLRKPRSLNREDVWSGIIGLDLCSKFFDEEFGDLIIKGIKVLVLDQNLSIDKKVEIILNNI